MTASRTSWVPFSRTNSDLSITTPDPATAGSGVVWFLRWSARGTAVKRRSVWNLQLMAPGSCGLGHPTAQARVSDNPMIDQVQMVLLRPNPHGGESGAQGPYAVRGLFRSSVPSSRDTGPAGHHDILGSFEQWDARPHRIATEGGERVGLTDAIALHDDAFGDCYHPARSQGFPKPLRQGIIGVVCASLSQDHRSLGSKHRRKILILRRERARGTRVNVEGSDSLSTGE